ncbi:MAG: hypothetical protein A2023_02640 [Sulfuricurvum sp. GWF2_44_89]|uniref:hypothetical protein n=1 Tax=Sulfuricurvum sp. RIFOXYD2_FULL_44_160 TaxID=1802249 RepID=UPI0008CD377C|nr:hypothetical protein [Sulfuricurvum sp. RIFOXYD2_FULL_44_160]OHD78092.1 MAG: hypothetical protein A2023_02640 [Sulfuricurvum sp. GWF2_44_89]OHD92480.1 MAG: hypothetical protein A2552_10855 [Sulfuricurvum sp. RIFOXYD2_FULL_44_160]
MSFMLTESDVIKSVCIFLENHNFSIQQYLNEQEKGDDIVAVNEKGEYFYIEAKGQTSSKVSSKAFGKEFSDSQKLSHVSRALYRAIKMKDQNHSHAGIALPESQKHVRLIKDIQETLQFIGIEVFWVQNIDGKKCVRVENFSKKFTSDGA